MALYKFMSRAFLPAGVGTVVVPARIDKDRVVPGSEAHAIKPRIDADAQVGVVVVIAKVVVGFTRTDKEAGG